MCAAAAATSPRPPSSIPAAEDFARAKADDSSPAAATEDSSSTGPRFVGDYYDALRSPATSTWEKSATGGVLGWCAGYVLMRLLKVVSALAGVGCLTALVIHYFRLFAVDWARMHDRAASSVSSVAARVRARTGPDPMDSLRAQLEANTPFSSGLAVGVMLGIASS